MRGWTAGPGPGADDRAFSPRMRGWTGADRLGCAPDRVFPAHAGMDRSHHGRTGRNNRFPRACGDDPGSTRLPVVDSRPVDHLKSDKRERFLSWLPDLVQDPEEVWLVPMKRPSGRRVVFRPRYLKVYRYGRNRYLIFVTEFHRGVLVGFTFFETRSARYLETRSARYLQNARKGFLRYGKAE